jgi:hypothetical protein
VRGVSPSTGSEAQPSFIWQHCNFVRCQTAQIRWASTPAVFIKDANVGSRAPEQRQNQFKGGPRAFRTVGDLGDASP